MKSALYKKQFN